MEERNMIILCNYDGVRPAYVHTTQCRIYICELIWCLSHPLLTFGSRPSPAMSWSMKCIPIMQIQCIFVWKFSTCVVTRIIEVTPLQLQQCIFTHLFYITFFPIICEPIVSILIWVSNQMRQTFAYCCLKRNSSQCFDSEQINFEPKGSLFSFPILRRVNFEYVGSDCMIRTTPIIEPCAVFLFSWCSELFHVSYFQ